VHRATNYRDKNQISPGKIMRNRWIYVLLTLLAVIIFATACSAAAPSNTPAPTTILDGATLVQERCSVCHPLARIERTRYSAADWQTIVGLMVSRGAQLSPQEEAKVVSYLATTFGK
jgi:hypothetical protein